MRRSAAAAAAGLDELINLARPGVDATALYADVIARLLELRSEYYPLALTLDPIDTLEAETLHESSYRQAAGKQCVNHQRSERDLRRSVDPSLPADLAWQNSR